MSQGKRNLSLAYRFLKTLGLNYSEKEYGNITFLDILKKALKNPYCALLQSMMDWVIFDPLAPRKIRPWLLRRMGAKVGKDVFIGDHCRFDQSLCHLITLDDHVHITSGTRLLCHKRDTSNYCVGDDSAKLPYIKAPIHFKKGSMIGMESMVMPGVTIGEGAIVGAAALVSKDIPDWCVAVGSPAKVVKMVPQRTLLHD